MMEQLLNTVTEKTGLSRDQAKAAVDTVLGFLKDKLPAPLASGLNNFVSEENSGGEGLASKASASLGSLFQKNG